MEKKSDVPRPDLVSIRPEDTIRRAADLMAQHAVGCLVVVEADGTLAGVITDRDLCVRAVAFDRDPDGSTVAAAMTTDVRTAPASSTREAVLGEMRSLGVRRMILTDEAGRAVGLTSIDDELAWAAARLVELVPSAVR